MFLPDGTPLNLTLGSKIWLTAVFGEGASDAWPGPQNPRQDAAVLFFATHGPDVLLGPGRDTITGETKPLVHRSHDLERAIFEFCNARLAGMSLDDVGKLAVGLWNAEHASQVIPVQKKSPEQLPTLTTTGD